MDAKADKKPHYKHQEETFDDTKDKTPMTLLECERYWKCFSQSILFE